MALKGSVRAHHDNKKEVASSEGGIPGVLGIRRENKNKWERRAPLAPRHVQALVAQGLKVVVQPSSRRVFTDAEYCAAGAIVQEDLSECATVVAVKEVPSEVLLPNRTWCFFSHTIKGQPAGMPLLDAVLEKQVRLVDYECITETGTRGGPRLVAFGAFAGLAGAIDFIRGLGERFLALGFNTPFLHVGSAFMYPSLEEACRAVALAGDAIRKHGLPEALCPFTVVVTGKGKVSQGALDILKLLPHAMMDPHDLADVCGHNPNCHQLHIAVATSEHMVQRRNGGGFNKKEYYADPSLYESVFQDAILPYSTVIVNGMYWDARFPRLFTQEDLSRHVNSGNDKLLGVCDITCDADGSVPTRQFTSIEQPFFIFNALTGMAANSLDEPGVLFHAVDHLPSELPREASEHFGDCLLPFLPALTATTAPRVPDSNQAELLPRPIRGAIVAEGGRLTRAYQYIEQLRKLKCEPDSFDAMGTSQAFGPHGLTKPPACATLELTGHLFDTRFVNQICDVVEAAQAKLQFLNVNVGGTVRDKSSMTALVCTHWEDKLQEVLVQIQGAAQDAAVEVRQVGVGPSDAAAANVDELQQLSTWTGNPRHVLVFGAGFVSAPLVEYLLRRPENRLVVASLERKEADALAQRYGTKVTAEVLDITCTSEEATAKREKLIESADLIVSLIPASLHVGVAQTAIRLRKPMVTASYVSAEMQALDAEARDAGVLIINEVGLDPGIDHMSAMQMIDAANASGQGRIVGFSSLCGGLPAPEATSSSPIGYKFSWSPKGVLMASQNSARYRHEGMLNVVPGKELLANASPLILNNALALETLPNRDSTVFADLYGLSSIPSFFRGTLRYRGFCERMLALARLGLLDQGPLPALKSGPSTLRQWLAQLLDISENVTADALRAEVERRLADLAGIPCSRLDDVSSSHIGSSSVGVAFIEWLGLFEEAPLPTGALADSPIDVMAQLLQRPEMAFQPGERDLVLMRHELMVQRSDGVLERRAATLIEYGQPHSHSAMARTVGVTAAICAQLVLDNPTRFGAGVQRPLRPEWYEPVLSQLANEGILLREHSEVIQKSQLLAKM